MNRPAWALTHAAAVCAAHGIGPEDAANRLAFCVWALTPEGDTPR